MKNFLNNLKIVTGGIIIMLFYVMISLLTAGPYCYLVLSIGSYVRDHHLPTIYILITIIPVILLGGIQFTLYEVIQNSSIWKRIKQNFVKFFLI